MDYSIFLCKNLDVKLLPNWVSVSLNICVYFWASFFLPICWNQLFNLALLYSRNIRVCYGFQVKDRQCFLKDFCVFFTYFLPPNEQCFLIKRGLCVPVCVCVTLKSLKLLFSSAFCSLSKARYVRQLPKFSFWAGPSFSYPLSALSQPHHTGLSFKIKGKSSCNGVRLWNECEF